MYTKYYQKDVILLYGSGLFGRLGAKPMKRTKRYERQARIKELQQENEHLKLAVTLLRQRLKRMEPKKGSTA